MGPKKEKIQISIRIDKDHFQLAKEHIQQTGGKITYLIERGLVSQIAAEKRMTPFSRQVRFLVDHAYTWQQEHIRQLMALLDMPTDTRFTALDNSTRDFVLGYLKLLEQHPAFEDALKRFSAQDDKPTTAKQRRKRSEP